MTTSLSRQYKKLIERFPLRPINNREVHEEAMQLIYELGSRGENLTDDESDYMMVLARLISDYEHSLPSVKAFLAKANEITPAESLAYLVEQSGISQTELAKKTGIPQSIISLCMSGQREFSKKAVVRFARFFKVSPELFLPNWTI